MPLLIECAVTDPAAATLAQAWALKDACQAAWTREPARAADAALALASLATRARRLPASVRHELDALVAWTGGIADLVRGQPHAACDAFDRAHDQFATLGLARRAAETRVPKIVALAMLGRHDDAARCGEAARAAFDALGDRRAAAKVALNLGSLAQRRDEYRAAARHYADAAVRFARAGDREHSVMADIGAGDALAGLGHHEEARRLYARARMRAATHALPVLAALVDESQALLELAHGRYREALEGLERARRAYERLNLAPQLAVADKQLADVYTELHLLPEALALLDRAVATFGRLQMADEQAWALLQRGRALAWLDRHAEAQDALRHAAAAFGASAQAAGAASVALARAELALAAGDIAVAGAEAVAALRGFARVGHADGRARAQVLLARVTLAAGAPARAARRFAVAGERAAREQRLSLEAQCLVGSGEAALAAGDVAAATRAFDAAIARLELQRRALPGDDLQRAFLDDRLQAYRQRLRIALAGGDAADVLCHLDRFRAGALAQRLRRAVPAAADAGTEAWRARLHWLARRARRLADEGTPSPRVEALRRRLERRLLERLRRQRLTAASAAGGGEASPLELCPHLHDGDAVVVYGVLDDELFACVATRHGVVLRRQLASWRAVADGVRTARFQLEALSPGTASMGEHLPLLTRRATARLRQLHDLVWVPLVHAVPREGRVIVVPHGALATIPFAALHDADGPIGRRLVVATAQSAVLALDGLRHPPARVRRVVAFGEPTRLRHAAAEALRVAGRFADGRAFVGPDATVAALHGAVRDADLLHVACHAEFRADNPMFSALHLHDGDLTAEAVESLPLAAGVVVLGGCDTGLALADAADERVGLVRAFHVAGARRVVASLWPVDDAVTALFMDAFYAAVGRGDAPASALQQAQLHVRRTHPHPAHWAAFAVHGGW